MPAQLARMLSAAGEPTRLRILNLLRLGSVCVCDLQAVLGIPQPTVSRHLAALRHAGLVADTRLGTRVIYSLAPATGPEMQVLQQFLDKVCPGDEGLREDLNNFQQAVRQGWCRLVRRRRGRSLRERSNATRPSIGSNVLKQKEKGR